MKLLDALRDRIRGSGITNPDEALEALKEEMIEMLRVEGSDGVMDVEESPLVILMVGVNGVGKTTGIARLTRLYMDEGRSVLLARETRSGRPPSSSYRLGAIGWRWT